MQSLEKYGKRHFLAAEPEGGFAGAADAASGEGDRCNPKNFAARLTEPEIAPQERKLV